MANKDLIQTLIESAVDSAIAPVKAACEVVAYGDVSDETAKSLLGDIAKDSLLGDDD